jgi:hypothetical protein
MVGEFGDPRQRQQKRRDGGGGGSNTHYGRNSGSSDGGARIGGGVDGSTACSSNDDRRRCGGGGSSGYVDLQVGNHLLPTHSSPIGSDQVVLVPSLFGSDLSMTAFDELRDELEPVMREKDNPRPRRCDNSADNNKNSLPTPHIEGRSFDGVQEGAVLVAAAEAAASSSSSWAGIEGAGGGGAGDKGVRLGLGRENGGGSSSSNAPENAEDADDDAARKSSLSRAPPEWAPSSAAAGAAAFPFSASSSDDDDDAADEVRGVGVGVAATSPVEVKSENCDDDDDGDDVACPSGGNDGDGNVAGTGGAVTEVARKLCRYFSIDPNTALVNGAIRFGHVALRTRPAHSYVRFP